MTTKNLPRLGVLPYESVECLSKGRQSTNELRVWLVEMVRNDANFQKDDWDLLFAFALNIIKFLLLLVFPCLNVFPAQKISNNTVEVLFLIPGASTKHQRHLRVKIDSQDQD